MQINIFKSLSMLIPSVFLNRKQFISVENNNYLTVNGYSNKNLFL